MSQISEISYVIPTLNSAATLDMTLLSLRSQKDVEVNIIVVDSGSTDGTLDICKRWDVKTLYAEPGNMYRAINTGLQECDTEWLGYVNSDDWLYPDSVNRLTTFGKHTKADIVYGSCDYTDGSGRFVYSMSAARAEQLLSLFRIGIFGFAQTAAIFRNRVYQKLKGFKEDYSLSSDADFYLRALLSNLKFSRFSGKSISCFRIHENQLTHKKREAMEAEKQQIYSPIQPAQLQDWMVFTQWRLNNLPHYIMRFLRQSLLSGKITITKSMDVKC
ncbi:MAG: glycosyltransferase [Microcystis aeruginosa Ma_MB_F_20061100_S19]|nr:glycosyltransferase [Microcystis aeruginosa L311-01]TRU07143.1 MAG: glycosyltransferase [Microcystis aeruginosa Ma_MB_F_20061100_S19D]TRU12438.1 MAG: glycosyltransferase [Microcystis aeruginosa Ma_MB_F_20061100_S19]